ncbi:MAG: hypothetical protein LBM16_03445 [Clostridiales bacterium]|jgi:hypothetical protein|nr:hypothetical protein [Clostridiales bacterium]
MNLFGFGKKAQQKKDRTYYKITCMNLGCMEKFEHHQCLFRLNPPTEVEEYRRELISAAIPSKSGAFSVSDDDERKEEKADTGELAEMTEYYYGNPAMRENSKYIYGGGDKPNYIKISAAQDSKPAAGPFPRRAYKIFFENNPQTKYVTSIVDEYGNETKTPVCPYCKTPVFTRAAIYETKILPVIGVSKSGKTVLFSQGLKPFIKNSVSKMISGGFFVEDTEMQDYLREITESLRGKGEIGSTVGVTRLLWKIESTEGKKTALYTFDLPGEYIANSENETYRQFRENEISKLLANADGLIIVFCPEQIEYVSRSTLAGKELDMRTLHDMIRLLAEEADTSSVLKTKNIPIAVIMTKLDFFKLSGETGVPGVNKYIDSSRLPPEAQALIDDLLMREEVLPDLEQRRVKIGEIDRLGQKTASFMSAVAANEMNMIKGSFAGDKYLVGSFAASFQGYDSTSKSRESPVRPNEPFYWLFAQMGIYEKQTMEKLTKSKGRR